MLFKVRSKDEQYPRLSSGRLVEMKYPGPHPRTIESKSAFNRICRFPMHINV